jgi:acyl-CoA-dependent ceramide synthase
MLTFILVITMARALTIRYILLPFGKRVVASPAASSLKKTGTARQDEAERRKWRKSRRKSITRFAEQFWSVIYYTGSLALSIYVAHREPYWMNERAIWAQWPYKELTGLTKVSVNVGIGEEANRG